MSAHVRSLRSILSWGTFLLSGFAVLATLGVIGMTTLLHRASAAIETSTQSVRLAEESEIDLLLHAQSRSPIVQRDLAASLQRRLLQAEAYVGTEPERLLLETAKASVRQYILAAGDEARSHEDVILLHAAAYAALGELVGVNVAQAAAESRRAANIDYVANLAAGALAVLIVAIAAFFIYWIKGPLVRPVQDLARAMSEFGRGNHAARARVSGPRELLEMGERFNEMAAQIERQRDQQRAFLAGVAHDLRNPISALLLSTETARLDASLPADHRARRALERNARQLRNLDRMVSDFLDAALVEAGQLELRVELCDLRGVVTSTAELFEGTSPRHELVTSLPPEPIPAWVDQLRIQQVISNLVSNGFKYSPEGGTVEVRLERQRDELTLAVTDPGLGMTPETQARLFEPFRRGLSREGIPGVGLGLFVVRRIVEAHHGRIEVQSAVGAGSTFQVFLPAPRPDGSVRSQSNSTGSPGAGAPL